MRMMRRRMCKRPLFSFEEIPPERAKYGVRETGKQCLVGPTEAKPGIFAGAKIPGCLLRALPPSPHKQLHSGAGYAFRWNAFSIAQTMDSTGQNPHQEQAAGGRCFALLTRFPFCAGEQTRGKAAAGFPSRKAQIHEPVIVPGSAPGCGLSLSAFLPHSP